MSNRAAVPKQSISNLAKRLANLVIDSREPAHTELRRSVIYIDRPFVANKGKLPPDLVVTEVINRLDVIQNTMIDLTPADSQDLTNDNQVANLYLSLAMLRDLAATIENYLVGQTQPTAETIDDTFHIKPSRLIPKRPH